MPDDPRAPSVWTRLLRSDNRCTACGHSWLAPFGEDLSSRCPACRSSATELVRKTRVRWIPEAIFGCFVFPLVLSAFVLQHSHALEMIPFLRERLGRCPA